MTDLLRQIDLRRLRMLFPSPEGDEQSDFFFAEQEHEESLAAFMTEPCRLNCYLGIFCLDGDFTIEINLKSIRVRKHSLSLCIPGSICRVTGINTSYTGNQHVVIIAVSKNLMSNIRFDFNNLFNESLAAIENPCITLNEPEREICRKYLTLTRDLYHSDLPGAKESLRFLTSSIFYLVGSLWTKHLEESKKNNPLVSARSQNITDRFLRLVAEYHNSERTVIFYADKMNITPKYLSKLIKNATGRSAPEWIDAFVILEIKNMLRHSDMPIKEIVYLMHFPNQSVFYKFFKLHTGLTPSEYRNGKDKSF